MRPFLANLHRLALWLAFSVVAYPTVACLAAPSAPLPASFAVIRAALDQALHLQVEAALKTAAQLEDDAQPTIASQLTRGMIAYFQTRWQTHGLTAVQETGHEMLQRAVEDGKTQLTERTGKLEIRLFAGLAAIFDGLLIQEQNAWLSLQRFAQGQTWLQQVLIADGTMTDAHLGLGLLYFAGAGLPSWLQRFADGRQSQSTAESVQHLQRAAEQGHFSQALARTFLARLYELEARYDDVLPLTQALQAAFPENGYYQLLTGRSQYAHNQYAACAATLTALARRVEAGESILAQQRDRFDLYYRLGRALHETQQYAEAFTAYRQAINYDPRALRDETLWAKYYLALLYERRGQVKTARQLYHTLLKGRRIEDLQQQIRQRLERLPGSP